MVDKKKIQFVSKNGVTGRQNLLKTFSIDLVSDVDGIRYKGKFTAKKLSIADLAAVGVRKAQLNGGMHFDRKYPGQGIDEQTDNFNSWIAHLDVALVEYPDWWDLDSITDLDVLTSVYKEVMEFENSFLLERAGDGSVGFIEGDSEADQEGPGSDRVVSSLVEQEVQSALEP